VAESILEGDCAVQSCRFGGYLVTRLDGYTQADAEALVTRAIAAEKAGAEGGEILLDVQPDFGVDSDVSGQPLAVTGKIRDESGYGSWNADMVKAGGELKGLGKAYDLEMSQTFVGGQANLLGYFSWGSNDTHYSNQAYESLTFAPGSIGIRQCRRVRGRFCRLRVVRR